MTERTCPECGDPVTRHGGAKFCSDECRERAKWKRRRMNHGLVQYTVRPIACVRCETPIQYASTLRQGGPKLYCSPRCRYEHLDLRSAHRQRYRSQRGITASPLRTKRCALCGAQFETVQPRAQFCSRRCKERGPKARALSQRLRQERRAAMKGAVVDGGFTTEDIAERDGWRCGICGRQIPSRLNYPHPRSLTLDHIVPLAAGGAHMRSNVQAAHFLCNSRKGDRAANDQLRLV